MSWSSRKEKEGIFCTAYFVAGKIFEHLCLITMYSVLNTISEYTRLYLSENITSYTFLFVFKIVESLLCSYSINAISCYSLSESHCIVCKMAPIEVTEQSIF